MNSTSDSITSTTTNNEKKVKFLCSFGGSILPRPQDGKLRYVGGETRIISIPRDAGFEQLMSKIRELYPSATLLKYQQPDEDLDALVSIVNDDDVVNMMEEYDKLGPHDAFTRLRIFLFSGCPDNIDAGGVAGAGGGDGYIEALNTNIVNYGGGGAADSPSLYVPVDEVLDINYDMEMNMNLNPNPYGLRQLAVPKLGSGGGGGYVEGQWSPAAGYYSPRCDGALTPSSGHGHGHFRGGGVHEGEGGGFPGNIIMNGPTLVDGTGVCGHYNVGREAAGAMLHPHYSETQQFTDRGWMGQNQVGRMDEQRQQIPGVGRMDDHYVYNGVGGNAPIGPEGSFVPNSYNTRHEDPRYMRGGVDQRGDVYHIPMENSYGANVGQQVLHSNPSAQQAVWRNAPAQVHVAPVYESYNVQQRAGMPNTVVPRNNYEDSPGFFVGGDHSPWVEPSHRVLGVNEPNVQDYPYGNIQNSSPGAPYNEVQQTFTQEHFRNPPNMLNVPPRESRRQSGLPPIVSDDNLLASAGRGYTPVQRDNTGNIEARFDEISVHCEASENTHLRDGGYPTENKFFAESNPEVAALGSNSTKAGDQAMNSVTNPLATNKDLSFLPDLIASVKRAKMESVEMVKARAHEDGGGVILKGQSTKLANVDEIETQGVDGHSEGGSDNENVDASTIELTKAEEEATAKGLQFIMSADLEEIRELGTGTYGAVYYGKWKGSDVAIKRIKASCFVARPSERERLIADFWKEALIMSSLHHPNIVSFYGIVRDGPDGSLATVTEFMVNGSLKQYLQKKDRTIDRRKRLIIAMDVAFGMEYLHGKNIVHFDLKCENLLVNMRDPHRPVCKIGDLGLSKVKQQTLVSGGVRGTLPWMAPELLSGKSNMVTEKIDVYSFGVVMWEVLTGEEPYKEMHCASIIGGIVNNSLRPQIPTWCDPEWKSLMESCWAPDPSERPSFPEISQKLRSMAAAMNIK